MKQFDVIKSKIDEFVKLGQAKAAKDILLDHSKRRLSRQERLWFAETALRIGQYYLGLRILKPLLKSKDGNLANLTLDESICYASLLTRVGAPRLSLTVLNRVDVQKNPQALIRKAFSHIYLWEYQKAIPLLEEYARLQQEKDYNWAISQVNLLSAYSFTLQGEKLQLVFESCFPILEKMGWSLLQFNALEILTGYFTQIHQTSKAKGYLKKALALEKEIKNPRYQVFLELWSLGLNAIGSEAKFNSQSRFNDLIKKARKLNLWNTVRETEAFLAQVTKNKSLADKVYFGSPYKDFHKQLLERMPWYAPPTDYQFSMNPNRACTRYMSLGSLQEIGNNKIELKPGSQDHKLLAAITADTYKASPLGEVFCQLYPGEYFDPDSSPRRVYVGVQRLRSWLEDNNVPLLINMKDTELALSTNEENYGFKKFINNIDSSENTLLDRSFSEEHHYYLYKTLLHRIESQEFTNDDIQRVLKLGRSAVTKFLQDAIAKGWLSKTKTGRQVLYKKSH